MASDKKNVQEIEVRFDILHAVKNSVRFKPHDDEADRVTKGFYLMNDSYEAMGKPDSITITVRPVKKL